MYTTSLGNNALRFLADTELVKLSKRAMCSGMWFRALHRIDRVLNDVTIKIVCIFRSGKPAQRIITLTKRFDKITASRSVRSLAYAYSFAIFLAVMHVNAPETFKEILIIPSRKNWTQCNMNESAKKTSLRAKVFISKSWRVLHMGGKSL